MINKILATAIFLNFVICYSASAQNSVPVCDSEIKRRYSGEYQDKYGDKYMANYPFYPWSFRTFKSE